jgi:hypothetical protein
VPAHGPVLCFFDRQNLERVRISGRNGHSKNRSIAAGGKSPAWVFTVSVVASRKSALGRNRNRLRARMAKSLVFVNEGQPGLRVERYRNDLQRLEIPARHICSIARLREMSCLSLPRPPPPVALLRGQAGISCLRHRASERIENAGILPRACQVAEPAIEFVALTGSQFRNRAHTEFLKIGLDCRSDSPKITEASLSFTPVSSGLVCPRCSCHRSAPLLTVA